MFEEGNSMGNTTIDRELLNDFISDTEEHIASAEENFLLLTSKGFNQDVVNTAYRNIHSIKGNCGFVHLYELQDLCHLMETIMGEMRAKTIEASKENITFLLEELDIVQKVVEALGEGGDGSIENLEGLTKKAQQKFPAAFGIEVPAQPAPAPAPTPTPAPAPTPPPSKEEPKIEPIKKEAPKAEAEVKVKAAEPKFDVPAPKAEPVKQPEPVVVVADVAPVQATKKPVKKVVNVKSAAQMEEELNKIVVSDDMRIGFIADSTEQLGSVEEDFLLMEDEDFNIERINNAYRNMHSFKGNCAFMRLDDFKALSHIIETVLQAMREEKIKINRELIVFLLRALDKLRDGVAIFEQGGDTSIPNVDEYRLSAEKHFPEAFGKERIAEKAPPPTKSNAEQQEILVAESAEAEDIIKTSMTVPQSVGNSVGNVKTQHGQGVRVDLKKLENIINLAGELVIAESMVTRNPALSKLSDETLNRSIHQLRRICNDLQDATMVLRMVPLSGVFKKMTRLVHDLSEHIGKKINLLTINSECEVDKTVSELINDPLVHIIRNACDHGIGTPEERIGLGKKEFGTITIAAEHRSGAVWISIKDDGRGLNREKILQKAIEQKLVSPDDVLTDDEVWKLILLPGFSTAAVVSDISGRGVGMDVVQKNIEAINGQIYIKTVQGKGTEFIIRIPLTLAIIDGMIIKVRGSLYIVPTLSIRQSLKYDVNQITYSPEGEKILKFQDKLIPIVHLANLFEKEQITGDEESGILIVVEESDNLVALFANDIVGQQQVVIKGLSEYVKKARGTSSCTILGDGSIALILDIHSLSEMALEKVEKNRRIPLAKPMIKQIK
jgi:two-component system chemotaxis sensor kinase CheA